MDLKLVLTIIGVALTIIAPLPYIRDIIRGKTKPHIITWLILSILVGTAFAIQVAGGGGAGSLVLGFTALMNMVILGFALRLSRDYITRFDLILLAFALLALIPWWLTDNPLLSIVLVTLIQTLGFVPTFRKSIVHPELETRSLYSISALKQAIGIMALSNYNVLTLLFPVVVLLINASMVALLSMPRKAKR